MLGKYGILFRSKSRSHQTQIDVPEEADEAEEDDPSFNRHERERDNRSDGPKLVSIHYDLDRLVLHVLPDRPWVLTLQKAHDDEEGGSIHDRAQCDAVDEPFEGSVAQIQFPSSLLPAPARLLQILLRIACI